MKSLFCSLLLGAALACPIAAKTLNIRAFGALGDAHTLDSPAIDRAIAAAAADGGGIVEFPAGHYLAYSIHLKSHVELHLDSGAVILAAEAPKDGTGGFDAPEANPAGEQYVDFGHAHWHNSLIWGDNVEDVGITGPGEIFGQGLVSGHVTGTTDKLPAGVGNKAIAFKNCRNVHLEGFTVRHGGHFAILATGVDGMICDGLTIDTNRDGIDIDSCRNVQVSHCAVNSPNDDAICPKSSFALGHPIPAENITITHCRVSGFDEGSLLDGTERRTAPSPRGPTGRIKCGTESNGGFRNIKISDCTVVYARGIALEIADGGTMEDVTVSNIEMRDINQSPIFIRLGRRLRRPGDGPLGTVRRIKIENLVAHNVSSSGGILIAGSPGNPVEDVSLRDISIDFQGGGDARDAARVIPEDEPHFYPDPMGFGRLSSWGLFARHVRNLDLERVTLSVNTPDQRPIATWLDAVGIAMQDCPVLASNPPQKTDWKHALVEEAASIGKPAWRPVLRHDAELHALGTHPATPPFAYDWEEIGIGYNRAFGHWDIVHEILDVLPTASEHAKEQLLNDLRLQLADGFLPGSVWMPGAPAARDGKPTFNTGTSGHPPVWVVAANDYFSRTEDKALLRECFERVVRQIGWFEKNRKAKPDGFFYNDILLHKWESGVDEGIRFDEAPSGQMACVDATSHVYQLYAFAAQWARNLGEDPHPWSEPADRLAGFMRTTLWDEKTGYFYDSWAMDNPSLRREAFEGLWPVIVGAASPGQAKRVINEWMLNPKRFFTVHPIATVGLEDPKFERRMWRGPAWNSMTYWAARGCMSYGRPDAAARLLEAALDDTANQFERTGKIFEFYDSTGGFPELLDRKPTTPMKHPFTEYLGHNPLLAMARLWAEATGYGRVNVSMSSR